MPRYTTLDQTIKLHGEYIPPYKVVDVSELEQEIWDQLVKLRVAKRLDEADEVEPIDEVLPQDDTETEGSEFEPELEPDEVAENSLVLE